MMATPSRRHLLIATAGLVIGRAFPLRAQSDQLSAALRALEARNGDRLGVCILDGNGRLAGHRLDERFAMCSTFKLALAGLILREADRGRLALSDVIAYSEQDLLSVSPVTTKHVKDGGMTVAALAEAAQTTSDNAAANLLLAKLGGPSGFTARLREIGDATTRLDRTEPTLNLVVAGDERDTTTPRAMARTAATLLLGDALRPASRDRLIDWMVSTTTGTRRIRAGLPPAWRAGDKTGTAMAPGMTDKYNDVAVAFPPGKPPLVIAAFYDTDEHAADIRDQDQAVLADVGRLAAAW